MSHGFRHTFATECVMVMRPNTPPTRPDAAAGLVTRRRSGLRAHRVAGYTVRGTLPARVNSKRIALCPGSAAGPNMHGQPPSMTVMPC